MKIVPSVVRTAARRIIACALTMLGVACAFPIVAFAQDETETKVTSPDLAPIRAALEEIRQLKFTRDVPAENQAVEEFKTYVMAEMEKEYPAEMFANVLEGVLRLGLVSERFDLGETVVNALLSQAGGYYNPENGTFYYLMSNLGEEVIQVIAAHELVHAMQDQHFDLKKVMDELEAAAMPDNGPRQDDFVLAGRALIEGEATYVQMLWQVQQMMGIDLTRNPAQERQGLQMQANLDIDQIVAMTQQQMAMAGQEFPEDLKKAMDEMKNIPRYILEPMYAAYFKGAYFTMAVRQKNGWDGVGKVYGSIPASSEQVIHPEKYLDAVDSPTTIELPDFLFVEEAGWSSIDSAVHGEFYLDVMLRQQGVAKNESRDAAAGWDGDVYRAYRDADDNVFFVFASTWDSEDDAREFGIAYAQSLKRKLGIDVTLADDEKRVSYMYKDPFGAASKTPKEDDDDADAPAPPRISGGAPVKPADAAAPAGTKKSSYGTLIVRGTEVFIVEGLTDKGIMERLIGSLSGMAIERVD